MPTEGETEAFSDLVARFTELVERREDSDTKFFAWQTGTVGGGPNGDGRYPLTNGSGEDVLVLCPAAMAAQVLNMGYQAQIMFDAALAASEVFGYLVMPANVRFPANFSDNIGLVLGVAPEAAMVCPIRRYAADGTGGAVIGSVNIATTKAVTFTKTAGGNLDLARGEVLTVEGPAAALAATRLLLIFKAAYRT